jgi:glucosamine-6-phosphate deaminase
VKTPCRARHDIDLNVVGDLDVAVVGVGRNDHVGFNGPGAHVNERTHVVDLAASTLETNFAGQPRLMRPTRAITLGLRDLIESRSVLMLVLGSTEASVLATLRDGVIDPLIPASALLDHQEFTIIADNEALTDV